MDSLKFGRYPWKALHGEVFCIVSQARVLTCCMLTLIKLHKWLFLNCLLPLKRG